MNKTWGKSHQVKVDHLSGKEEFGTPFPLALSTNGYNCIMEYLCFRLCIKKTFASAMY